MANEQRRPKRVFISYRRRDAPDQARLLRKCFADRYKDKNVFALFGSRAVDSQSMKSFFLAVISTFLFICFVDSGRTQDLGEYIESYTARLSGRDHFNSSGQRLREPAAIIRQDRANFYVYGLRDPEDQPDSYFSSKANRARLEQMLSNGRTTREAINAIVNGTPLIRVDIYEQGVTVTIVSN